MNFLNIILSIFANLNKLVQNKKILLILIYYGVLNHIFELSLFYLSFNIFNEDITLSKIILLFSVSFTLDRIPFIRQLPGLTEILFATISLTFGYDFVYAVFTKLLINLTGLISISINYIFSLIANSLIVSRNRIY